MRFSRRSILADGSRLVATATVAASFPTFRTRADEVNLPSVGESLFADANGIRMHYVRAGTGPLVVLVHGWPQTWFAWHGIIPRLASTHTVIAVDLRGCGRSQRTESGYDKRTIAKDIRALILHAGFKEACLVGHDMGGKASYFLAHLYPDAVAKLVLVDCLLPGTENLDALRGGAWHYGFHMAKDFPEMLTNGREREYIASQIKAWSHKKDAITDVSIDEFARHYATAGGMTAGFNYYRALKEDALFAETLRAKKLKMPVMAIAGKFGVGDKLADALSKESDRLTRVIALDSGHFVAEESPDFFVKELSQFLAA